MSSMPSRDNAFCELCKSRISFLFLFKKSFFEEKEITKAGWIAVHHLHHLKINGWINIYGTCTRYTGSSTSSNFHKSNYVFPSLGEIGFEESNIKCFLII
jgi:deoxyribodipyrimidine photo-lyase